MDHFLLAMAMASEERQPIAPTVPAWVPAPEVTIDPPPVWRPRMSTRIRLPRPEPTQDDVAFRSRVERRRKAAKAAKRARKASR
jgi:hypothetical protein